MNNVSLNLNDFKINNFKSVLIIANGKWKNIDLGRVNMVLDEVTENSVAPIVDTRATISIINREIFINPDTQMPYPDVRLTSGIFFIKKLNEYFVKGQRHFRYSCPYKLTTDLTFKNYDLSGPVMFKELAKRVIELKWIEENCYDVYQAFEIASKRVNSRVPIIIKYEVLGGAKEALISTKEFQEEYNKLGLTKNNLNQIMKEVEQLPQVQEEMRRNEEEYKNSK